VDREREGFIIDERERAVTITKRPSVRLRKAGPAALFFVLCLAGAIASAISLGPGGEWQIMSTGQRALSAAVIVVLAIMSASFGRSLYLALERGFRVEASAAGVILRRHHFSKLQIPRELITAVRVRGRSFQPPRQPRYCQVRVELELRELDDALDLFALGSGKARVHDSPEHRERLAAAAIELGDALAEALGVAREWIDFPRGG